MADKETMCYTARVSLFAFAVGAISSVCLFVFGDRAMGVYLGWVALMQLADYAFWRTQTEARRPLNAVLTKVAMFLNFAQPVVLGLAVLAYGAPVPAWAFVPLAVYTVFVVAHSAMHWSEIDYTLTTEEGGSLFWKWNAMPGKEWLLALYLIAVYTLALSAFPARTGLALVAILTVTLLMGFDRGLKEHVVGRFWCYFAAFAPLAMLVLLLVPRPPPPPPPRVPPFLARQKIAN
jgi:hypothetical protein